MSVPVIAGGAQDGVRIEVHDGLVLGREGSMVLDDQQCSRRHAVLRATPQGTVVEDLGSRNGTWVNGARIAGPTLLQPGDQLYVGSTTMLLEQPVAHVAEPSQPAPEDPFAPLAAGVSRGVASRQQAPTLLTFATIAATALVLVLYFATR